MKCFFKTKFYPFPPLNEQDIWHNSLALIHRAMSKISKSLTSSAENKVCKRKVVNLAEFQHTTGVPSILPSFLFIGRNKGQVISFNSNCFQDCHVNVTFPNNGHVSVGENKFYTEFLYFKILCTKTCCEISFFLLRLFILPNQGLTSPGNYNPNVRGLDAFWGSSSFWTGTLDKYPRAGLPECVVSTMSGPPSETTQDRTQRTHSIPGQKIPDAAGNRTRAAGLEGRDSTDHPTATN